METKTKAKSKAKEPDMSEKMMDSMFRVLKKDHNWKIFLGMVIAAVIFLIV